MMEPRRLLDDASGLDRAILESAADDAPADARRRRVVAALGIGSVSAFPSASAARRLGSLKLASWKIVIGIAATAGLGIGGAIANAHRSSSASVTVPSAVAVLSAAPVVPAAPVFTEPAPSAGPEAPPPPVVTAPSLAPPRAVKKTAIAPQAPQPSIAREIALIDRARSSIASSDAKGALAALDEYDMECRGGVLSLEAAILRIEALAASGDPASAAGRARAFLERHPRSAYDARVRAHLRNP